MTANRGVRKVTERILKRGNGIIVTDKDKDGYGWDEIPPGSKFIDYETGIEWVKLKDVFVDKTTGKILGYGKIRESDGVVLRQDDVLFKKKDGTAYKKDDVEILEQTNWVPAHTRDDGTLCVARDSKIAEETFTIIKPNDGSGNMEYANSNGEHKKFPIQGDGSIIFELERGSYIKGRNHLEVFVDDVLRHSVTSGGLKELTEKRFAVSGGLKEGQEVTARYICISRYGSPYQRVYINVDNPEDMEVGDMWLDYNDAIDTSTGVAIDSFILSDEPFNSD